MVPGQTFVYDGTKSGRPEHEEVLTMNRTKRILGIPCVVQQDKDWLGKEMIELTYDYFAQDQSGNVWYMGEYATQYRNGQVRGHNGSWQAGVNGAQGGIIMEANPQAGDRYSQENYPGHAEDKAKVISLTSTVSTPYGNFIGNALETFEWSPLDPPHSGEHKWYAPGIGFVKSRDVNGGEVISLTAIR